MARLILNCEGVGLVMRELGRDIVMIGRAPSNQIVIDHPTVSAQHAVLLKTGASYSLKDLDSTNGTQINDILVTAAELKDDDTIRLVPPERFLQEITANGVQATALESSGCPFGQRRTADGVRVLKLGLKPQPRFSKKSLVDGVRFGYALQQGNQANVGTTD